MTNLDARLASYQSPVLSIFRIVFGLMYHPARNHQAVRLAARDIDPGRHLAGLVGWFDRTRYRRADNGRTVHPHRRFHRVGRDGGGLLLDELAAAGGPVGQLLAARPAIGRQWWRTGRPLLLRVPAAGHHRRRRAVGRLPAARQGRGDHGSCAAPTVRPLPALSEGGVNRRGAGPCGSASCRRSFRSASHRHRCRTSTASSQWP